MLRAERAGGAQISPTLAAAFPPPSAESIKCSFIRSGDNLGWGEVTSLNFFVFAVGRTGPVVCFLHPAAWYKTWHTRGGFGRGCHPRTQPCCWAESRGFPAALIIFWLFRAFKPSANQTGRCPCWGCRIRPPQGSHREAPSRGALPSLGGSCCVLPSCQPVLLQDKDFSCLDPRSG